MSLFFVLSSSLRPSKSIGSDFIAKLPGLPPTKKFVKLKKNWNSFLWFPNFFGGETVSYFDQSLSLPRRNLGSLDGVLLESSGFAFPNVVVGLLAPSNQAIITVPDFWTLVRPRREAGVVDALVAVFTDDQVLVPLSLVTNNTSFAIITGPADFLEV
jgi:hypothetical protein